MTDTSSSHTVGQNKQQSEDETPHRDATAPKEQKVEPGETLEHAAKDKRQNAEARAKHNSEHLGSGEFEDKCYFCELQRDGGTVPVLVPDQPPAVP